MKEKRYALTPLQHKILSEPESKIKEWSKNIFLISLGIIFPIIGKVITFLYKFSLYQTQKSDQIKNLKIDVKSWEIWGLSLPLFVSLILFLLSKTKLDNSERKKLMKTINDYFNEK